MNIPRMFFPSSLPSLSGSEPLSFLTTVLYSTEESLKDGAQLKQLLLKALTLMLDAAESYAKVTSVILICPPALARLGITLAWALPSEEGVYNELSRGQRTEGTVTIKFSLPVSPPPLSLRTPVFDRPCTVTGSPS